MASMAERASAVAAEASRLPESESPAAAILDGCGRIAERLEEDGFRFLQSARRFKRVDGDLTFEIRLQADKYNARGSRAVVWIDGAVLSKKLALWRRDHPSAWIRREGPDAGLIVSSQIGNLLRPSRWMHWNFARPDRPSDEAVAAVVAIRRIILPFFAKFDDPRHGVEAAARVSPSNASSLVEYALVALGPEAAEAVGCSVLRSSRPMRRAFEADFKRFTRSGVPNYTLGASKNLAVLAVVCGLDLTRQN